MSKVNKEGIANFRTNIMGINQMVPTIHKKKVRYINFDNAASTPALLSVFRELEDFMGWYSGVHRGTGYKSLLSSQIYDDCHQIIGRYVKTDMDKNIVILVKNTTEAINKLSYRLGLVPGDIVISTMMEHHSNDLPWRKKAVLKYAEIDEQGRLNMNDVKKKLKHHYPRVKLLTVTGASNVTGHTNNIYSLAELAHEYKARILVDAAQLIPHCSIDIRPNHHPQHIDYLVFSGHKLYAPFGIGVLIGPRDTFLTGEPEYVGGGTVDMVTRNQAFWTDLPDREEAGSPNVIGAFALAKTMQYLEKVGMDNIAQHESELTNYALQSLKQVPGLMIYGTSPRVGVISFNMKGISHGQLGAILCHEAGIGVRTGCFCAQNYVRALLGEKEDIKNLSAYENKDMNKLPGMVRISLAAYSNRTEIDVLVDWLNKIAKDQKRYQKRAYSSEIYPLQLAGHEQLYKSHAL